MFQLVGESQKVWDRRPAALAAVALARHSATVRIHRGRPGDVSVPSYEPAVREEPQVLEQLNNRLDAASSARRGRSRCRYVPASRGEWFEHVLTE